MRFKDTLPDGREIEHVSGDELLPSDSPNKFETVLLEKMRFFFQERLSEALLMDAGFDFAWDGINRSVIVSMRGSVLTEKAGEVVSEVSVVYPLDWWQAVKERFAPAWFKRLWPVVYLKKTARKVVELRVPYPGFKPAMSQHYIGYVLQERVDETVQHVRSDDGHAG